jgi:archaellum component FlaF (FlaF/FlaG flagellin family)
VRSFTSGGAYRTRVLRQSSRFPDRSHDDEAINAAVEGDEVVIAAGMYAEDLYIDQPITLTRANVERVSERVGVKALIIGRVVVAASAINVTLDGIAIEGNLDLDCIVGATASLTLRNSCIEGRHTTTGIHAKGAEGLVPPLFPGP